MTAMIRACTIAMIAIVCVACKGREPTVGSGSAAIEEPLPPHELCVIVQDTYPQGDDRDCILDACSVYDFMRQMNRDKQVEEGLTDEDMANLDSVAALFMMKTVVEECAAAPAPVCGDGTCDASENSMSCPVDCSAGGGGTCGDGTCGAGENSMTCFSDCTCGDGVCDSYEQGMGMCPQDCG